MRRVWLIRRLLLPTVLIVALFVFLPRSTQDGARSREASAIAAIRAIHTAQTEYYSQFDRYATSLAELGSIDSDSAIPKKLGYVFTVTGNPNGYSVEAVPEVLNGGAGRTFYSDQTMVVHEHHGPQPATARDPESK
jgi:type IV pilus assembly protein PilA